MKNMKILGYGKYIPKNIISNDDMAKIVDTSDEWIYSRTGIKNRAFAVDENTSDLCTKAGFKILENANVSPEDVELVLVCTMSPDYIAPSTAAIVANNLGIRNAFAFDISAACSGFIYGLSVAQKYILSGMYNNILLIGGEVLSKTLDFEDRSTCVLFGDGAAGVLISATSEYKLYNEKIQTDGSGSMAIKSCYMPNNNYISKKVKDKKFLEMDGKSVYNFVTKKVPNNIKEILSKVNTEPGDIDFFIPHQANKRLIELLATRVKIPIEKVYINIDTYGNTSAASIPIALAELFEKKKIKSGSKILMSGFGAGLTWGSVIIEI